MKSNFYKRHRVTLFLVAQENIDDPKSKQRARRGSATEHTCHRDWQLESHLWDPQGGRREPTPTSRLLASK